MVDAAAHVALVGGRIDGGKRRGQSAPRGQGAEAFVDERGRHLRVHVRGALLLSLERAGPEPFLGAPVDEPRLDADPVADHRQ